MTRYRIGLVGDLDHLRPHLLGAGFDPCGGPFGHAATTSEIDSLLQRGLKTPVLVSTRQGDPTWSSWLRRLLDSGVRTVVVGYLPAELQDQHCRHVNASASLADALLACGASRAMVPDNLAAVSLTAPVKDRSGSAAAPAPDRATVNGVRNGSPIGRSGRVALADPPAAPRRGTASSVDVDDAPEPGAAQYSATARSPEPAASVSSAQPTHRVPGATTPRRGVPPTGRTRPAGVVATPAPGATPPARRPVSAIPPPGRPASVAEIFDRPDGSNPHAPAEIIVVFGARGGLGKTSLAQAIAGTSADRGRRTVLVDADRGQGDQALLLRLDANRPVPSAYDTVRTGRPGDAIASPGLLNELRGARRDRVRFALVAAPPESVPGAATVTTPGIYRSIVDHAARLADLVVVDTHPIAAAEPSEMATDLILPLMRAGAWGVGLTDCSIPGLKHLEAALGFLIEQGVPQDRLMTIINRVPASANLNMELLGSRLSRRSHWIGPIFTDEEDVQNRSNAGIVLVDVNTMAHQVENILNRACGLEVVTAPPGETEPRAFGPFRRLGLVRWGR